MARDGEYTLPAELMELIVREGLDVLPELMRVVISRGASGRTIHYPPTDVSQEP